MENASILETAVDHNDLTIATNRSVGENTYLLYRADQGEKLFKDGTLGPKRLKTLALEPENPSVSLGVILEILRREQMLKK